MSMDALEKATAALERLTEKHAAIRQVLVQRRIACDIVMNQVKAVGGNTDYYLGKRDGYDQALELLDESLESILVEL